MRRLSFPRGAALLFLLLLFMGRPCFGQGTQDDSAADLWSIQRRIMVETQIKNRGVKDKRVLEAMKKVERQMFVPAAWMSDAYNDTPLPIGLGQTISQPYITALMTERLQVEKDQKILEIGSGSGSLFHRE